MPPAGFETTIPASERAQTNASDLAATGIGVVLLVHEINCIQFSSITRRNFFLHGSISRSEPWPPRYLGFAMTLTHTLQSVGVIWTSDQPDP